MGLDAEISPGAEFEALARKMRGADKAIRREMSVSVKNATAPAEAAMKRAVLAIESKGSAGGGGRQRGAHGAGRSKSGKLPSTTGLRKNIAKGITRKITYSGYRIGIRIRVDGKYLPADQQVLIKRTNDGKSFRHPVMGNRDAWVAQQFGPAGWFDDTMRKHLSQIKTDISKAMARAMNQLQ